MKKNGTSVMIATMADLDGYAWPDPGCDAYYQPLTDATRCLPALAGFPVSSMRSRYSVSGLALWCPPWSQ